MKEQSGYVYTGFQHDGRESLSHIDLRHHPYNCYVLPCYTVIFSIWRQSAISYLLYACAGPPTKPHWWSEEALKIVSKYIEQLLRYNDFCVLKFWLGSPYSRPNFGGFSGVRPPKSGQLSQGAVFFVHCQHHQCTKKSQHLVTQQSDLFCFSCLMQIISHHAYTK